MTEEIGRQILAVDPGLDGTGLAAFDLRGWTRRESWTDVLHRIGHTETLYTTPEEALAFRLASLHARLNDLVADLRPDVVYIEEPPIAGARYAGRTRQRSRIAPNAADLGKLQMAVGALVVGITRQLAPIRFVPPPKLRKTMRLAGLTRDLAAIGHPLGSGRRPRCPNCGWIAPPAEMMREYCLRCTKRGLPPSKLYVGQPSVDLLDAVWLGAACLTSREYQP